MTEREYVEKLREVAETYIDKVIRTGGSNPEEGWKAFTAWCAIRDKASPHTIIRMADAWLEKQGDKE